MAASSHGAHSVNQAKVSAAEWPFRQGAEWAAVVWSLFLR